MSEEPFRDAEQDRHGDAGSESDAAFMQLQRGERDDADRAGSHQVPL